MNTEERVLMSIGLMMLMLGSFMLGTLYPVPPAIIYRPANVTTDFEYVPPQSREITSRQNIISARDIMLGRDMGMIRYGTVYMEYKGEYFHIFNLYHSTTMHSPTGSIGANEIKNIEFWGYVFKVRAWNSDYIALEVLAIPVETQSYDKPAILLGRGLGQVQYKNITLSYSGQDIHLTDSQGNWMFFTMTHFDPPSAGSHVFRFSGVTFNVTYWSWDYVKIVVVDG